MAGPHQHLSVVCLLCLVHAYLPCSPLIVHGANWNVCGTDENALQECIDIFFLLEFDFFSITSMMLMKNKTRLVLTLFLYLHRAALLLFESQRDIMTWNFPSASPKSGPLLKGAGFSGQQTLESCFELMFNSSICYHRVIFLTHLSNLCLVNHLPEQYFIIPIFISFFFSSIKQTKN